MSESIRPEVSAFLALAPLPASKQADPLHLERLTELLLQIRPPVSRQEARLLVAAFGPDECFGLAWTLVHLIESAPGGAPLENLADSPNEWTSLLRERRLRASRSGD